MSNYFIYKYAQTMKNCHKYVWHELSPSSNYVRWHHDFARNYDNKKTRT
jgi:hypothetical protein